MSVEKRIRQLVSAGGGRVSVETVVREALGLPAARPALARKLAESALTSLRGLALEGDEVVERAMAPASGRALAVALAPTSSPTALPSQVAWSDVPRSGAEPSLVRLDGEDWREQLRGLAVELAGGTVLALSAGAVRRLLRLASRLAGLEPDEEPEVVALGLVARALGTPIGSAEEAAALVGEAVPDSPRRSARVLAELGSFLADRAGTSPVGLAEVLRAQVLPPFEFGARAFGRAEVLALPEAPGVYLYEDEEGAVVYVGKSKSLRRRVASYFLPEVDERVARVREAAHGLSHERTGSELSALLREHELIRDLRPPLNVQTAARERRREEPAGLAGCGRVAVVQASAEGGAEIVLLDRRLGTELMQVLPSADGVAALERRLLVALLELAGREPASESASAATEIALSWLADHGDSASLVDASGEPEEVASLLARLARDPDLAEGRIVPR